MMASKRHCWEINLFNQGGGISLVRAANLSHAWRKLGLSKDPALGKIPPDASPIPKTEWGPSGRGGYRAGPGASSASLEAVAALQKQGVRVERQNGGERADVMVEGGTLLVLLPLAPQRTWAAELSLLCRSRACVSKSRAKRILES